MTLIRPSRREDTPAILALRKAMFEDHRANDARWKTVPIPDDIAGYWEGPETSRAFCFVAEHEGRVIGYIVAGIDPQGMGSFWEVSVSFKRHGVGTLLYRTAVDWLIQRGVKTIEATAPFWNAVSFKILERLGFREWTRTVRCEVVGSGSGDICNI